MTNFSIVTSVIKSAARDVGQKKSHIGIVQAVFSKSLAVWSRPTETGKGREGSGEATGLSGPFFLSCPYCDYSSLDAGIEFSKPNKISEQLHRMRRPKKVQQDDEASNRDTREETPGPDNPEALELDLPEHKFSRLLKFYKTQLSDSDAAAANPFGFDASYSSPSNLARIMQLYGGLSASSLKKAREKPQPMREALTQPEGLTLISSDKSSISQIRDSPSTIPSESHLHIHPWNSSATSTSSLWPVPTLLTARRSKRCRTCRHILIRHDDRKPTSTSHSSTSTSSSIATSLKYKIRLLAQAFIPRLTLRAFSPSTSASNPVPRASFALTTTALTTLRDSDGGVGALRPGAKKEYLLVVQNPLFETVRINLATPGVTPGKAQSRVTVLCPSFEVGADGDVWDAALSDSTASGGRERGAGGAGSRSGGKELLGGMGMMGQRDKDGEERVPEAGKVWERGRNWVGVVVEVVPGQLPGQGRGGPMVPGSESAAEGKGRKEEDGEEDYDAYLKRTRVEKMDRTINDDVLEIPVFVRAEWDVDVAGEEGAVVPKGAKEKREVAFWCVLGAGRIVP
ncbi:putative dynactin p62 family protein [Elsinoe australis]|uniref:Dynactin subunit 4 n=1 Tax=Elsinoe australis TaxID=40998 RepID=A0A4U7APE1_9PEZI|nr:putative dynactin p62 family protein [Elsinoe australis]